MTETTVWMAIVAVAVVVALVLIWLGYHLALDRMRDTHVFIAQQKAALDAEWWRLDQTRRIRSVFLGGPAGYATGGRQLPVVARGRHHGQERGREQE